MTTLLAKLSRAGSFILGASVNDCLGIDVIRIHKLTVAREAAAWRGRR